MNADEQPASVQALVDAHLYLVQHVVNQLAVRYPRHVDRSELWAAGALGLVEAATRFDPDAGIAFPRYATIRVRGAMVDSTRSRDLASRGLRRALRAADEETRQFEETRGRTPNTAELAGLLGISEDELRARQAAAAATNPLHLDQELDGDDGPATLADTVVADTPAWQPEDALADRELVGSLHAAVEYLPEPQREVIERSFLNGELLRDIAASLGVTEARVSQIRSQALLSMRSWFAQNFDGVQSVPATAPGQRQRAAYLASMSAHTTWRSRLDATARPLSVANSA